MSQSVMIIAAVAVLLIGAVLTVMVGLSKENKEGNPAYDRNSIPNWIRLSVLYVAGTVIFIVVMVWVMRYFG
ncbi:hypothetical protein [Paenibacillus thermotolerans]|uniref:hypothetical protein n=1 Tax=Paenibacillus thermotolerans TaxID=3027807 RepID=UPI002368D21E|nr:MULTISPECIES: hypothetical protein [unclassified Paenibacillus]